MAVVAVEYPAGQLSASQKLALAEELTAVLLEIEGGGDTPRMFRGKGFSTSKYLCPRVCWTSTARRKLTGRRPRR